MRRPCTETPVARRLAQACPVQCARLRREVQGRFPQSAWKTVSLIWVIRGVLSFICLTVLRGDTALPDSPGSDFNQQCSSRCRIYSRPKTPRYAPASWALCFTRPAPCRAVATRRAIQASISASMNASRPGPTCTGGRKELPIDEPFDVAPRVGDTFCLNHLSVGE